MSNSAKTKVEKSIVKILESCISTKQYAQITLVQATHASDVNKTIGVIHSCMELIETCNLCIYFVTSNSPLIKSCLKFTTDVLKNTIKECEKLKKIKLYTDIENQCSISCAKLHNDIKTFNNVSK